MVLLITSTCWSMSIMCNTLKNYAQEDMLNLNHFYLLKKGFGPPDIYLRANVDKSQLEGRRTFKFMTCVGYLSVAINKVDLILACNKSGLNSFRNGHSPYPSSCRPELYVTNDLDAELIKRFQHLIGVLRWSIELGRINTMTEVKRLSQHLCSPREGHINAFYKIFSYLQNNLSNNPGRI